MSSVEVQLLGPVRVQVDGMEVEVGGTRPRTLVAALALAGGQPVPAEELISALWGVTAPPTATATLRAYVSRLRKLVGDALRRDAAGYALDAEVDALRFLTAAEALTADLDADRLADALALWRGPLLHGAADTDRLRRDAQRLVDAHVRLRRAHADLQAAAGDHDAAVESLRRLAAEHPDREAVTGDLMLALYRAGRQQEALEHFRDLRSALMEAAGLEPGQALRDLHQRILAQDPALLRPGRPDPPADVPAPARADGIPAAETTNLPLPLTSFVGRAAELDAVPALVDDHRMLTLTGPGGTGKTRLALEVCRRRDDADGPWLVELAAVEDPAFVATAVAEALRIGVQDGRPPEEVLATTLARRRAVVLLDNCEHVIDGAAAIAQLLLSRCPGMRILATSREPLGVPGERIVAVGTLPVVQRSPELLVEGGDAMRLFLDRARDVVPDLDADPATMELVRRICQDLDGLPLAIELAAAELRALSPTELEEQLADRFAVLTGGPRTALPRHRTLQTTVAWSVDLLDAAQRSLFAELSTFVGGFGLDAVRQVCGPDRAALLPDLVERSLVEVDTTRTPRRYRLLETLRQYGRSLLDDVAARDLADRHARWVAALAAEAGAHLQAHDGPVWERVLDQEVGNIRAGLRTMVDHGHDRQAVETADALWWWWFRRARVEEGRAWAAEIADLAPRDEGVDADLRYGWAYLAFFAGRAEEVEVVNEASIAQARRAGDGAVLARNLTSKAYRMALHGRLAEARRLLAEGLDVLPDDAPEWLQAECRFCAGQVARAEADAAAAESHLSAALELAQACGHRWVMTVVRWILAEHALDGDRPREAAGLLAEALDLALADGDRTAVLGSLRSLAGVAARQGHPTEGARLLGMVAGLSRRIGVDVDHMERTDADRTEQLLRAALAPQAMAAAVAEGDGRPIGEALALAGQVLRRAGHRLADRASAAQPAPDQPAAGQPT